LLSIGSRSVFKGDNAGGGDEEEQQLEVKEGEATQEEGS
jgi:hypothetical protein